MRSVRGQLATGMFITLGVVFLAVGLGLGVATRSVVEAYMASRLDRDAEGLVSALRYSPESGIRLRAERANPAYLRVYSGRYFHVLMNGHGLRSRSLWQHALEVPRLSPGESRTLRLGGPADQALLARVHGYRKGGHDITIAVAEDLTLVEQQIRRWQLGFAGLTLLVLFGLLAIQRWLLRRSFAPLDHVRDEVSDLERGERRGLSEAVPAEALPLVQAVNRLLGLLDERLQRSRKAAGNLAHALKAPLTVLTRLKEDPALRAQPELQRHIGHELGVIHGRVERELKRARIMGGAAPGTRFSPTEDLPALIQTLNAIYGDRGLAIERNGVDVLTYSADREDMLELLGNLLDNAYKWARARVRVELSEGEGLSLSVEDDGPGVDQDHLPQLQRRGERLDESVAGHGLGLAIAHDIVDFYAGDMGFDQSPRLGGLRVRVHLPHRFPHAAPPPPIP